MTQAPPLLEAVKVRHRRFNVDQIYAMLAAGVLTEDDRVELIEGELLDMNPIGSRHSACVNRLVRLFDRQLQDKIVVSIQNPIRLDSENEPQPDVTVLHPRDDFYESAHPNPADVYLIVEVADTTLRFDRQVKSRLYARFGIPEYWVADVEARTLEIFRKPAADGYGQFVKMEKPDEEISPMEFVELKIRLKDIVG